MKKCMLVLALALTASVGHAAVKNVVLVHGAFADGSGWSPLAAVLERDGYTVFVVQEPETTFEADVAATRLVLDRSGPCVLVGHSYGGMVITEAGVHPSVKALVYVAAFEPSVGESAGALNGKTPPAGNSITPGRRRVPPGQTGVLPGRLRGGCSKAPGTFHGHLAGAYLHGSFRRQSHCRRLSSKPSYAVVAKDDRMINPDLERFMTGRAKSGTIELPGSHAVFLSHPKALAALIEKAARAAN